MTATLCDPFPLERIMIHGGHKQVRKMADHVYKSLRESANAFFLEDEVSIGIYTIEHGTVFLAENILVEEIEVWYEPSVIIFQDIGGETAK